VRATAAVLNHPRRQVEQAAQYTRSLVRVAVPKTAPPSFGERSAQRRLIYLEVPADDLRGAGRSAGGTLNDGYLAGVTGGITR
jgi:diacylglycerol O-acyltransferase